MIHFILCYRLMFNLHCIRFFIDSSSVSLSNDILLLTHMSTGMGLSPWPVTERWDLMLDCALSQFCKYSGLHPISNTIQVLWQFPLSSEIIAFFTRACYIRIPDLAKSGQAVSKFGSLLICTKHYAPTSLSLPNQLLSSHNWDMAVVAKISKSCPDWDRV